MAKKNGKTGSRRQPAPAGVNAAAARTDRRPGQDTSWPVLAAVIACFLLSGFAALLYQTAWLRQFSIVFGTSEIAVATVLAAYMGGLALGAAVAGRYLHRVTRPVLVYGLLEAGIALSALAVPFLLAAAGSLYVLVMGGQPDPPDSSGMGQTFFYLGVAFVVLAVPTGFMGATLPLLIRHAVRTERQIGSRVALLYGINTAGAVLGTIVAGFILLPALGLRGTVWTGVAVNGLVFLIARSLAVQLKPLPAGASDTGRLPAGRTGFFCDCVRPLLAKPADLVPVFSGQSAWILPVMAVSGANAFLYEVLWTRLLNHVLGGSIYAFATMLASFLTGIAIGGAVAGRFAATRSQAITAFTICQVAIAVLSATVYAWIEQLVPETRGLKENAFFAAIVMLPSTVFIGATFPLAVRILSKSADDAGECTAGIYAWNTVGAIAGAILAGFYIIPALGFEGTVRLAVTVNLLLALLTGILISTRRMLYAGIPAAFLLAVLALYHPQRPGVLIRISPIDTIRYQDARELFFAVGRSSSVYLMQTGGTFLLRTNGLPEASMYAKGSPPVRHSQKWLASLPVTARPEAESMLIVGFGGGMALEGVPPSVRDIDVVELEPEVINANRAIGDIRAFNPLTDPRVNIVINDARNALRLTTKKYDIIVSQPSHPWTAGASHLFTREFISLAGEHLHDSGVFLQWMNSQFADESLLRSLAATLLAEFEYVRLYQPDATVLFFLASQKPIEIEEQVARTGRPLRDNLSHYSMMGMNSLEDILVTLTMDEDGLREFARFASPSTDDRNLIATRSNSSGTGLDAKALTDIFSPYDPLLQKTSRVFTEFDGLSYPYMVTRLFNLQMDRRANRFAGTVPGRTNNLLLNSVGLALAGKDEEADRYLRAALAEDPYDATVRYAMISGRLSRLATGSANDETIRIANSLTGPPGAVVQGWKYAAERDWQRLARLDSELGRSEPTDMWYTDAAQLRAEWRTKVLVKEGENRFARDAMRILDRALMINPALDLYVLRAGSAILLKDPDATVESARYVGTHIEDSLRRAEKGEYSISAVTREIMMGRLNALIIQMDNPLLHRTHGRNVDVKHQLQNLLKEVEEVVPYDVQANE